MSNTIPPLVCDTPPPIDFDQDDDFGGFESHDSTFSHDEEDNSLPPTPKHVSHKSDNKIELDVPIPCDLIESSIYIPTPPPDNCQSPNKLLIDSLNTECISTNSINALTADSINSNSVSKLGATDDLGNHKIETNACNNSLVSKQSLEMHCTTEPICNNEKSIDLDLICVTSAVREDGQEHDATINCDKDSTDVGASKENSTMSSCPSPLELVITPPIDNYVLNRSNDSPPSLELSPEKYSDNDEYDLNINDNVGDVDDVPFDDCQCGDLNIHRYDDSTSIPSLKLDSIQTTPPLYKSEDEEFPTDEQFHHQNTEDTNSIDKENSINEGYSIAINSIENETEILDEQQEFQDQTNSIPTNKESDGFAFEADFSQFCTFEGAFVPPNDEIVISSPVEPLNTNQEECTVNHQIIEDDFDDFQEAPPVPTLDTPKPTESPNKERINDNFDEFSSFKDDERVTQQPISTAISTIQDDGDDEFGDFNDFQQSTAPPAAPILKTIVNSINPAQPIDLKFNTTKIKPLLDEMFPTSKIDVDESNLNETHSESIGLSNDITTTLKDFENSRALDHQWLNSSGKSSLVKALGIDSRNILYGEKWNSSMPRFAANLGFTPLEPMKPTSVSVTHKTSTANSSTSVTIPTPASTVACVPEVPAAQFDWNSSGLVNPLDASHAHTLLLDLEQLVVVANLDKIKLDSSSTCSVSQSSSACATKINLYHNQIDVTSSSFNEHNALSSYVDTTSIDHERNGNHVNINQQQTFNKTLVTDNYYQMGTLEPYSMFRGQEVVYKADTEDDQSARFEFNRKSSTESNVSDVISPKGSIPYVSTALSSKLEGDNLTPESSLSPGPVSASYVVPGSGTLKETHIFTPSKSAVLNGHFPPVKESRIQSNANADLDKPAVGSVIDESVVKKEYRDVVYDPAKLKTSNKIDDEFSEFQSVVAVELAASTTGLPLANGILEPIKAPSSIVINWPQPGNIVDSTNIEEFSYPSISDARPIATQTTNVTENVPDLIDSTKPKELTPPREYKKPVIGVSPTEHMFSTQLQTAPLNAFDDEFTEFHSTLVSGGVETTALPQIPDVLLPPTNQQLTNVPFILPLSDVSQSTTTISPINKLNEEHSWQQTNNNISVPMATSGLSVAPLVPLPSTGCLMPEVKLLNNNCSKPRIEWPDPGIDPDEMARLEALFPQPKSFATVSNQSNRPPSVNSNSNQATADVEDEWTNFVSVSQPQLPITNILSQSLQKQQNDDDDWSDFVSSTGPAQSHQLWTSTAAPNFPAWNAPPSTPFGSSGIFQSSGHQIPIPAPPLINTIDLPSSNSAHHNGYNNVNLRNKSNSKIALRPMQNHSSASIISLPDLGFVGPKTLVNTPKSHFEKK